jgi:cobalamin synthase
VEARDRLANLGTFGVAAIAWVLVALVVVTRDPRADPAAGLVGAALMGLAVGLTTVPLFWLAAFGRHRRIAYRGDWARAVRRGLWVGMVVGLFVALRLQGILSPPIAVFVIVLVVFAELTLSIER